LVKLADGYYCQFCIDVNRQENITPSRNTIGLDVGLKEYYTDSNGVMIENPKFLRIGEKVLKRSQRRVSRKVKGSKNRGKARQVEGATKELKRLLDKHYSPHTLPIKCHLIANQRHHFQDQFLTLIHRNYPTRTV
jgi:putative transposase